MNKFDRFQQLHRIFKVRRTPIDASNLAIKLDCSVKTVLRAIRDMKNYLDAPIFYSRAKHGYQYLPGEHDFELPGLWMTGQELQSLVIVSQIIRSLNEGLLAEEFGTLEKQVIRLLKARGIENETLLEKVKWLPLDKHFTSTDIFGKVSEALLSDMRIVMSYESFKREKTVRKVSPVHLIYYRENWYLDAWCHLRNELRSFMLCRISSIEFLEKPTKKISREVLREMSSIYK